jgi:MoaA/NifB/PqqE/SkfB family radical SAM enzyme
MELKGVHFLLTYKCDSECDHCFVWSSPESKGTFTLSQIRAILAEAKKLGSVRHIAIEGGEPFLFYPIVVKTVSEATGLGFHVEVLSNCYWATSPEDALEWLSPIAQARNVELSLSSDLHHGEEWLTEEAKNAVKAAETLGIKTGVISVKKPGTETPTQSKIDGTKVDFWDLMYRGRATSKLADKAEKKPWHEFTKCPYEKFEEQQRVHIDPYGYVHVCQGIAIGNAWKKPLSDIIREFNPHKHPILEPLINGGPTALAKQLGLPPHATYADACHLCYETRLASRSRFPDILAPDQMYGMPRT